MRHNPRNRFRRNSLAVGISAALSMGLLATSLNTAQAARFELGDVQISFDSTFSAGTSWRIEDRNWSDNVGKSNNLKNNFDFSQYHPIVNPVPTSDTLWKGAGSYSNNGDLGGLNYNAGESFSNLLKGSHELDVQYENVGVFMRGMYFYDFAMMNGSRDWSNPVNGDVIDPCDDSEAKEQVCTDIRLLDAYVYGDFDLGEMPFSIRVGNQVISWGESTLISHGISEINPVDIARLRAPGAELKEAFIPFGAVWASLGVTENINLEMFYQYSWERTILPPPGSYFSTNDFAGDGGHSNNVQLGFTGNPDIDLNYLIQGLNQVGAMAKSGNPAAAQAYLAFPTKVTLRAPGADAELRPDDGGQYGMRFSMYLPSLNDTELSLYYVNYHSRRPLFSGQMANFTQQSIGSDLAYMAGNKITEENYTNLSTFSQVKLAYPEDIKMYAMSFNTNIGTTAVSGEVSYRQDEPLQIDDVELLYAAMPQQLANAGIPGYDSLDGLSQFTDANGNPFAPGVDADGFIISDTLQAQMTLTHLFGPTLGANQFVGLIEVGGININDMPNQSDLRLNGPGTARSGEIYIDGRRAWEVEQSVQNGVESNPFPTEFAWGYKAVAKFEYNNVFAGVNINPRIVFSHDVKGITPDPLFMFIEDRKSISAGITFDYQSSWSADFTYNGFWDGVGTTNKMEDRDYVSFSIKYSI